VAAEDQDLLIMLLVALAVLGVAALLATAVSVRLRRENQRLLAEVESLRRPVLGRPVLEGAPHRAAKAAGWAVRAVVDTAGRVRERGFVGGVLLAPIEELAGWALQGEDEIEAAAMPDGTVAFLFSDIEGSTELNERLGDREWIKVLAAHDRAVRAAVTRHGGHVVKTQGDGFMVAFGSAEDAVATAVDVQRAVPGGHRRLRHADVRVRIGVHVGPAVSRDGDYFGRNVAMAARVAARARGGQVLVSEDVRTALVDGSAPEDRSDDRLVALDPVELKGLAGKHVLYAVSTG
jgi:adenylate cyclase